MDFIPQILVHADCNEWHVLDAPPSRLRSGVARFGHSAHMQISQDLAYNTFSYKMYVIGGFNGQLLNDVLLYKPGKLTICSCIINLVSFQSALVYVL